jgi:hypothetical protein
VRVNISYTIELDDVPKKVVEFLTEVEEQRTDLAKVCESAVVAMDEKNYTVAIEQFAAMRDFLASMDANLDNCMHIISGYSKTLADVAVGKGLQAIQEEIHEIKNSQDG